jgi:hypothetical protein
MSCSNGKPCNLQVKGYKIFKIEDDGIYVSKSKEDLLENVKKYGDVEEVYGVSEQELLEEMREIPLCSKEANEIKDWSDDEIGCIYDLYKSEASLDRGTTMILTYNL